MSLVKKTLFFIPSVILSLLFFWSVQNLLIDPYLLLSPNLDTLIELATILGFLTLGSILTITSFTLSNNWRISVPASALMAIPPLLIFIPPTNYLLTTAVILSYLISFALLSPKLARYLTFKPTELLTPSVKQLVTLILLSVTLVYYQGTKDRIETEGFKLPDSLIETALNLSAPQVSSTPAIPQLSDEQLQLLRQNPALLQQYGIDPKILDQLDKPTLSGYDADYDSSGDLIQAAVQSQIDQLVRPYRAYLPLILAGLFFITLNSLASLLSILISPFLWITFLVLEKTGFTKYQTEQRTVKKLVV